MTNVYEPLEGAAAPEVLTEYEEDPEEDDEDHEACSRREDVPREVDEEEDLRGDADYYEERPYSGSERPYSGSQRSDAQTVDCDVDTGDYAVPDANKEVWKQFGCNTEAGRMLRRLYSGPGMKAAASKVSYPKISTPTASWQPPPKASGKPCPQRAAVQVPRRVRPTVDPDDPRYWRMPIPCRKPAAEIIAEMEASAPEKPNLPPGRDQRREKEGLQDRFQYCGGRMMPKGAMGYVESSAAVPKAAANIAAERRQLDENGMNAETREIFEELAKSVADRQARLKVLDAEDIADPKPSKAKTARNKEALQLRNDIERDLRDLDKLLELTDAAKPA
eukprot:TRINITY_DN8014_c0_g1_i1.p1 TRINITY_DN8014_c0_g1~~TRINITY_DN8014_c0_g1_i1.p1  ORF type:complete len:334 (+),score=116.19 TRINITY_DN8014_c0_g1_i1:91-1092(+)